MKTLLQLGATTICIALYTTPASAGTLLYDNTNGFVNQFDLQAWNIRSPSAVANSFSLAANSTLDSITFWVWEPDPKGLKADDLTSVSWAVQDDNGSTIYPFDGSIAGSGVGTTGSSMTGSYVKTVSLSGDGGPVFYDIYQEVITVSPGLALSANTAYWLTLNNGVSNDSSIVFWDQSNGSSNAYQLYFGVSYNIPTYFLAGSESFLLQGESTATPEPGSAMLLGGGMLLMAGLTRRKAGKRVRLRVAPDVDRRISHP